MNAIAPRNIDLMATPNDLQPKVSRQVGFGGTLDKFVRGVAILQQGEASFSFLLKGKHGSGQHIRIPFSKPALTCWGYMQAVQDFTALADEKGQRVLGICPPDRATMLDIVQAFVRYADARGKDLPDNAALAVTQALQSAYPCTGVAEKL
jgi:Ssp1 endopeptidase immunity protein Rap1a